MYLWACNIRGITAVVILFADSQSYSSYSSYSSYKSYLSPASPRSAYHGRSNPTPHFIPHYDNARAKNNCHSMTPRVFPIILTVPINPIIPKLASTTMTRVPPQPCKHKNARPHTHAHTSPTRSRGGRQKCKKIANFCVF